MYPPTYIDAQTAELQMPNPWVQEEMQKMLPRLLPLLRDSLQNDHLKMRVTLKEFNADQMAYTAEEQYKQMVETNPLLAELKEKLDLVID